MEYDVGDFARGIGQASAQRTLLVDVMHPDNRLRSILEQAAADVGHGSGCSGDDRRRREDATRRLWRQRPQRTVH
jgi:hypothetical protein